MYVSLMGAASSEQMIKLYGQQLFRCCLSMSHWRSVMTSFIDLWHRTQATEDERLQSTAPVRLVGRLNLWPLNPKGGRGQSKSMESVNDRKNSVDNSQQTYYTLTTIGLCKISCEHHVIALPTLHCSLWLHYRIKSDDCFNNVVFCDYIRRLLHIEFAHSSSIAYQSQYSPFASFSVCLSVCFSRSHTYTHTPSLSLSLSSFLSLILSHRPLPHLQSMFLLQYSTQDW